MSRTYNTTPFHVGMLRAYRAGVRDQDHGQLFSALQRHGSNLEVEWEDVVDHTDFDPRSQCIRETTVLVGNTPSFWDAERYATGKEHVRWRRSYWGEPNPADTRVNRVRKNDEPDLNYREMVKMINSDSDAAADF